MIGVKQLIGPGPMAGDCMRAVIASLLELTPSEVPHFFEDRDAEKGWSRVAEFLADHDLAYVETQFAPVPMDEFVAMLAGFFRNAFLMVGGFASAENHVVIYRNGLMVHDPSWFNRGLSGPVRIDGVPSHWSIGMIVPASMVG